MIASFVDERKLYTVITLLVLLIIYICPSLVLVLTSTSLPINLETNFAKSIESSTIDYQIVDYELIKNDGASDEILKGNIITSELMIDASIIYSIDNKTELLSEINNGVNIVLLFSKDHLEIYSASKQNNGLVTSIIIGNISYRDANLNNIDFRSDNTVELTKAFNKIDSIVSDEIWHNFKWIAVVGVIVVSILSYFINVLLISAMAALFRIFKFKFGKLFKITIYCSAPYVALNIISKFTDLSIFGLIGVVLMVFYVYLAGGAYQRKIKEETQDMKGDNNEL